MAADDKPRWQSQLPGGGNNIPASYLRRFALRGAPPPADQPRDEALARFLRDEL